MTKVMKRPVLNIFIFFCTGIVCQRYTSLPIAYSIPVSLALLALAVILLKKAFLSHVYLYAAIFFFGMAYYQNSVDLSPDHVSRLISNNEKTVILKGSVIDDPVTAVFYKKHKTTFILSTDLYKGQSGSRSVSGKVKVDYYSKKALQLSYGDEVIVEGILRAPDSFRNPGTFDYSGYLRMKGIYATLVVKDGFLARASGARSRISPKKIAYFLRHKISNRIDRHIGSRYATFLKAILVGYRSGLSGELKEDFEKTGTFHILAISGLHAGLVAALSLFVLGLLRFPKKFNLAITAVVLLFYSLLAGSNPPVVRAAIIYSIFVIGYIIDRDSDILNSLSCAAFIILLWNPSEIFGASFQLSFMSVASIVLFSTKLDVMLEGVTPESTKASRPVIYLRKSVAVSLAAWLGVWPVVATYFNIVSPVAIAANLIVIPLLFLLIIGSVIFLLAGLIGNMAGIVASYALITTEKVLFNVNHFFADLPLAYFRTSSPSSAFMIIYYLALSVLLFPEPLMLARIKVRRIHFIITLLILFNILIWNANLDFDKGILRITFFDVGKGDSALIEFPNGASMLIDSASGGQNGRMDMAEAIIAPCLWNKGIFKIDALLISHFHEDHAGGAPYILKNFRVGCVIDNGGEAKSSALYDTYKNLVKKRNINRIKVADGDIVKSFDGADLFVLNPARETKISDPNNNSIVIKLVSRDLSALFCADIEEEAMEEIVFRHEDFIRSDIFKIPHHDGPKKNKAAVKKFLKFVSPEISVFSVGKKSVDDRPSEYLVSYLTYLNSSSYNTAEDGAITVSGDYGSWRVVTLKDNKTNFFIPYLDK